jgi:DNA-binding CsgD family transcriptional regulator
LEVVSALPERLWLNVLAYTRRIYAARTLDDLVERTFESVRSLVPTDILTFNQVGSTPAQTRHWINPDPIGLSRPEVAAHHYAHLRDHPVYAHYLDTGDPQAYRITDFVSQQRFEQTALFDIAFRPTSVTAGIVMFLEARAPVHAALAFHRDANFSDQELRVIQLLRPHFAMARQNILALEAARDRGRRFAAQFTVDFIVIVEGRVREFAGRSSQLLSTYFPRTERGPAGLPDILDCWLRTVEDSLAHADRPVGTLAPFVADAPGRQLVIRPMLDSPEAILLLEEKLTALGAALRTNLPLSKREREVLLWVSEGKTARDIAAILDVSPRTVHKHLENIYGKLGVANRVAAIREVYRLAEAPFIRKGPS